ncbi:MAG: thermosome subunit [Euryarchaeota archaeon]|nr:thermosome subunit [Euryarchaeota archaeon]
MSTQLTGQPVYILQEGSQRIGGRDARRMNIMAARIIAEAVKSTMGPKGMDKMLVDSSGNVVITNDGAAILKEVEIKHPTAKMMVEVAKTVEKEAGDGTTSAVVLAGELLKRAEELLDQDVHANVIARGYRMADAEASRIIDGLARKVDAGDRKTLLRAALTALNSKAPGITAKEHIARLCMDAVLAVAEETDDGLRVDKADIKVQKAGGDSTGKSELVKGVVIDKERAHSGMPVRVKKARIALLNTEMKVKKTETDAKIDITSPEQLQSFLDSEEEALRKMVEDLEAAGANCLFCQKDMDDVVKYFLARKGIFAVKSVDEKDMKVMARATGASILTTTSGISRKDLGTAELVEERKVGEEEFVFISGCRSPKAVTLFLRGGTEHVVDEVERSVDDAISVVRDIVEDGSIICGGGASAMEIAKGVREFANSVSGREQLAVIEFAKALEVLPRTLAENAGLDPVDALIALRAAHEKGRVSAGINLKTGRVADMFKMGIVEPARVRRQTIKSATEVAVMILRIDDVIAAKGAMGEEEE